MKLVNASLFSRLPAQFFIFAFAGLWTLFLPEPTYADPLELQASLVQEQKGICISYLIEGSNFNFRTDILGYCSGSHIVFPGEIVDSSVILSATGPAYPFYGPVTGSVDVPENPGRNAILSGYIDAEGPSVTVPLLDPGSYLLEVPIAVKGTFSVCLTPADEPAAPFCNPNYLDFANLNVSVFGFDVFNLGCFGEACNYSETYTGSGVPEPANMAPIGLTGFAVVVIYGRRKNLFKLAMKRKRKFSAMVQRRTKRS